MTKIPAIYDIGNFALDWNNITNIGDDERILWQAPKDGIIFYDTVNGAGDLNTSFMISPEFPSTISKADPYATSVSKLSAISWETPGNYSMNYIGGGGSLASHGSYAVWAPIKKGEYVCFIEQTVNSNNNTHIFRRQFIPFLYQGSQITDFGSYAALDHTHTKNQITDFPTFTGMPDYSNAISIDDLPNGGSYTATESGFLFFKLAGGSGSNGTASVNGKDLFVVPTGTSHYQWIIVNPGDTLVAKESTTAIRDIVFVPFK